MTTHKISCVVFFGLHIIRYVEFDVMAFECNEYVVGIL
jgi:hypothetical protein